MPPDTLPPAPDYVLIGHVAADREGDRVRLGGTAAYAGLTARALGRNVAVVTAAAPDLDISPLADLRLHVQPSESSTTFENRATPAGRRQILHAHASRLGPDAVPDAWRRPSIAHLAPIAREVDPRLLGVFAASFVGITAQGWLRRWGGDGRVVPSDFREFAPTLRRAGAVVVSLEDLAGDRHRAEALADQCQVLALTEGPAGATVFSQGRSSRVPAPAAREVDSTGAGDIFAAMFFIHLAETGDAGEAARLANELASRSVERRGLASTPTEEEARRAREPVRP